MCIYQRHVDHKPCCFSERTCCEAEPGVFFKDGDASSVTLSTPPTELYSGFISQSHGWMQTPSGASQPGTIAGRSGFIFLHVLQEIKEALLTLPLNYHSLSFLESSQLTSWHRSWKFKLTLSNVLQCRGFYSQVSDLSSVSLMGCCCSTAGDAVNLRCQGQLLASSHSV